MNYIFEKSFGDFITVCGTLLIFFNWVSTNVIVENIKSRIEKYKQAEENRKIRKLFDELRQPDHSSSASYFDIRSAVREITSVFQGKSFRESDEDYQHYLDMHHRVSETSKNAVQIDRACDLAVADTMHIQDAEHVSLYKSDIHSNSRSLDDLRKRKDRLVSEMWQTLRKCRENGVISAEQEINTLQKKYRETLENLQPLLKTAVDNSNFLSREILEELKLRKIRLKKVKRVSTFLYMVGTIFTVYGAIVSKLLNT